MIIKKYKRKYISFRKIICNNGVDNMENRYCSVEESLEVSLKQMQLIKNKELPKKTWKDLCSELKKGDN